MSGFESNFLIGWADYLAAAGLGLWSLTDPYVAGNLPVIVLEDMPQQPDRVISLGEYTIVDDPALSDSVIGLQIRTRWDGANPLPVKDLAGSIFNELHGLRGVTLSTGIKVVEVERRSGTSLGKDGNQRWSRSDNYYATVHRPSSNRT